ncbi:crossover junction endodeoxyribonuclease RuvC [Candidatus Tisiphia endosymbiont of Temnostethus pusillus]|uniref:crossover junction endodeoxyribonuclease RuvC n=1 Tax=Candidatus Tisiphia endosymbiont of Temnostethus pusillus TaxID=3139335 RepID=UPI0035C8842B
MNNNISKTILALDLGTTLGWAIRDLTGRITFGTVTFKLKRFEGGGMPYLRFKQWLTELKNSCIIIDAIYFEEVVQHKGVDAAHKYGGFLAHLTAWCEHHQIPYQGVPVGTIKKYITGKGNASKQEVIKAVKRKGFTTEDHNEADSLALLDLILSKYN